MITNPVNFVPTCNKCNLRTSFCAIITEGVFLIFSCNICRITYHTCIICKLYGVHRNYFRSHSISITHGNNISLNESSLVTDEDEALPTSTREYLYLLMQASCEPSAVNLSKSFPHHSKFYIASSQNKGGNYLVKQALSRVESNNDDYMKYSDSNTLFTLVLAYFTSRLSRNECNMFASLLSYVKANAVKDSLFVPTNEAEARNRLHEGKFSIYANLPMPPITVLEKDDVVYVPLKNTIMHMFSKKSRVPHPFLPFPESTHACSPRGGELLRGVNTDICTSYGDQVFPLKLVLWTDAFQCFNVSINSEASAHTCTATVGALDGDHSGSFSFPVWLGRKNGNRDEVERLLVEEINELSNNSFPVYHSGIKRVVKVKIHLYTFLCDRPDKSGLLSVLSSKYCARFGYAGDLSAVINSVVCCPDCLHLLSINQPTSQHCSNCFGFDFSRISYPSAESYPKDRRPTSGYLPMKRLKFAEMSAAVSLAYQKIRVDEWSVKAAKSFLRSEGIGSNLVNRCVKCGQNALLLQRSEHMSPTDKLHYENDRTNHPSDYAPPTTPAMWNVTHDLDIGVFIDAYMHLLFLGVMKAISTDMLMRFLTPQKKVASFVRSLNIKIGYVHSINAQYMPINKSCGESKITFGGCLSRQWITICRLSKWLFSHVGCRSSAHSDIDVTVVLPTHVEYFRYLAPEIKSYCFQHDIPLPVPIPTLPRLRCWFATKMSCPKLAFDHYDDNDILNFISIYSPEALKYAGLPLSDTRRRIMFMEYVYDNKLFPTQISYPPNHIAAGDDLMTNVVVMFHCFVSRVMGTSDADSIDRHCKAFLTDVHKLDTALSNLNSIPMLLTRFNLLTLLNTADAVRRFGSARSLWEGGMMGEGSIPRLKQRIHDMKKSFAKNAMSSFYSKEAMIDLIDHAVGNINITELSDTFDNSPLISLIESARTIKTDGGDSNESDCIDDSDRMLDHENNMIGTVPKHGLFESSPIVEMVVDRRDHIIYVLVDKKQRIFSQILVRSVAVQHCGCDYFSMDVSPALVDNSKLIKDNLVCGFLCKHPTLPSYYYAVSLDWKELTEYGVVDNLKNTFLFPRSPMFVYDP